MNPLNLLSFLLLFLCSLYGKSTAIYAQSGPQPGGYAISGKLVNTERKEVMFAALALVKDDSTIVGGAVSDSAGDFVIEHLRPGTYRLQIEHLEYQTYTSPTIELEAQELTQLGPIVLQAAIAELSEVVVTYRKPPVEVKADRLVFNVDSSPSAAGLNGLDLLRQAPGVSVDLDDNILLLGKSGVRIFINNVPTNLSGSDLVNRLQSMTSDQVAKIEIISNPPARYEAEGSAGIINIMMKKNQSLGFHGRLNSGFEQGRYFRYYNGLSLNYSDNKLRANLDLNQADRRSFNSFLDTKIQQDTRLELYSPKLTRQQSLNITAGLEYLPNEQHSLNLSLNGVHTQNDNELNSRTGLFEREAGRRTGVLLSQSIEDIPAHNYSANLNHFWNLGNKRNLTTAVSLSSFSRRGATEQPNTLLAADATTIAAVDDSRFVADGDIKLWSAKTDYEQAWEEVVLAAGLKYTRINTQNGFAFFNYRDQVAELDPNRSNDFNYYENVAAAYTSVRTKLHEDFNLQAGLRVEQTLSQGLLISDLPLDNKDVSRRYTDFFPNVSLSFDPQGKHNWSIGVGRRITRPNYQDLNPFETPVSQLTIWKGNPFLRPKYVTNYQASYSYQQKLVLTSTYSVATDFFASIFEITGPNSNQIIPRNMQRTASLGFSLSYPLTVTKSWQINSFVEAAHTSYQGDLEGTLIDLQNTIYNYRMQHQIKLPGDLTLDLTYYFGSDWIWRGSIRVEGNQSLGFGLRKEFLDGRLRLQLTGRDVLRTTNDYFYAGNYGGIEIDGVRSFDSQRFGLGATFKFGKQEAKLQRRTKGALEAELNRIED